MLWRWRLSNSSEFISTLTGAWLIFESCSSEKNSQSQISFKGQGSSNMLYLCNAVYAQFPGRESCCELTPNDRFIFSESFCAVMSIMVSKVYPCKMEKSCLLSSLSFFSFLFLSFLFLSFLLFLSFFFFLSLFSFFF